MSSIMFGARSSAGRLFQTQRSLNSEPTVSVVCSRTWNSQSSFVVVLNAALMGWGHVARHYPILGIM